MIQADHKACTILGVFRIPEQYFLNSGNKFFRNSGGWWIPTPRQMHEVVQSGFELTREGVWRYFRMHRLMKIADPAHYTIRNSYLIATRYPEFWVLGFMGMVPRGGIEPPTRGFSILCSTD